MAPVTPTLRQRILASDWLPRIWMLGVPLVFAALTIRSVGPLRYAFSDVWSAGQTALASVLAFSLGYIAAIPTAWVLFGPILMDQGVRNGGPFKPGDLVQIISGPHRNRISRVYSTWQHETLRVDLGVDAKASYSDIFADYQLLRVDVAESTTTSGRLDYRGNRSEAICDVTRSSFVFAPISLPQRRKFFLVDQRLHLFQITTLRRLAQIDVGLSQ